MKTKFSCGHDADLNGLTPAVRKLAALGPCPVCYEKSISSVHEEETAENEELNLPPLFGSSKAIAWATSIRLSRFNRIMAQTAASQQANLKQVICGETRAKFWIDTRNYTPTEVLLAIVGRHPDLKRQLWTYDEN